MSVNLNPGMDTASGAFRIITAMMGIGVKLFAALAAFVCMLVPAGGTAFLIL